MFQRGENAPFPAELRGVFHRFGAQQLDRHALRKFAVGARSLINFAHAPAPDKRNDPECADLAAGFKGAVSGAAVLTHRRYRAVEQSIHRMGRQQRRQFGLQWCGEPALLQLFLLTCGRNVAKLVKQVLNPPPIIVAYPGHVSILCGQGYDDRCH